MLKHDTDLIGMLTCTVTDTVGRTLGGTAGKVAGVAVGTLLFGPAGAIVGGLLGSSGGAIAGKQAVAKRTRVPRRRGGLRCSGCRISTRGSRSGGHAEKARSVVGKM